jgi:SAM-dependent methyltransferase
MLKQMCRIALALAVVPTATVGAQSLKEAEAKMFSAGDAYEAYMGRWSKLLAPAYVSFAGVKDGERVLDVGTGTGSLAAAVEAKTKAREIVGIDPSAGSISYAKQRTKSARVRFEVGDGQALPYRDASFDHAMSQFVVNFIPDHEKALREMRRVTRPGGVVSSCVWDYGAGMESLRIFWDEAVALEPAAEPKHERNMKLTREGELGALWRKVGLVKVREQPLVIEQAFSSFDDFWGPFLKGTGPGGAYVVSLGEEPRRKLEARMRERLLGGRADGAFALKARAWCVRGEVAMPG